MAVDSVFDLLGLSVSKPTSDLRFAGCTEGPATGEVDLDAGGEGGNAGGKGEGIVLSSCIEIHKTCSRGENSIVN